MLITEKKLSMSMSFLTNVGKTFTLSMANVDPELKEDDALETKMETAMAAIITLQPFAADLESSEGWSLTATEKIKPE